MNRISSFSDIPGTVWKIGNQNEPVENDTSYVGANCWMQESPRIHGGSLDTAGHGGHDQQMLMNRSASEFAFEQFLKEHVSALLSKSNMKPSVAENEDEKGKDATENEDVTGKDVETEDFTGKAVLYEDEKGKYGAAGVGHSEVIDLTEACLEKECSKEDVALFPNGVETSEQLQVSQALNPLFTGLPHQMPLNHTNPQAYENFLNQRLDLACAAVALTRSRGSFWGTTSGSLAVVNLEAEHSNYGCQDNTSISKIMSFPALVGIPALPPNRKIEGAWSMTTRTTSGSSREQSDNECGTELSFSEQSIDPYEIKRMRKMLSNRESARRSRQRKQTHLTDLEMQVAELRVENFSLLKKLAEISQRFNEAAIDNRVLKSDVEALRAKVKVAEEIVARMTASPAVTDPSQTMCNNTNVSSGLRNCLHVKYPSGLYNAYSNTRKVDPSMFIQPGEATSCENTSSSSANLGQESSEVQQLNVGTKMVHTCSMQRVASLEHLQKRLRAGTTCGSIWNGGWEMESPTIIGHGSVSEFRWSFL